MKNYKFLFLIGIILIAIPFIIQPSIVNLKQANFVSGTSNSNTYKPSEQIHITFTYKNTWFQSTNFIINCDLNGERKSITRFLTKGETITESFIINAPAQSGNYNINLNTAIELSTGRYVDGDDGSITIPITVEEVKSGVVDFDPYDNAGTIPTDTNDDTETTDSSDNVNIVDSSTTTNNPKLIVNSNIEDVVVSYSYESKTIGSSKTVEFTNIPTGKTFEFTATKDGYEPSIFDIILTNKDKTVTINMQETVNATNFVPNQHKLLVITLDKNSMPIQNCRVFIDNTTTQFTDINGSAMFNVTEGNHLVVISNDDYLTVTQNYDIIQNSKITIRMTDKTDFTNTEAINTNISDLNYLIYIAIAGGMLIVVALIIFLIIKNKKNKK